MQENTVPKRPPNRKRPIQKIVRFSPDEWAFIQEKVKLAGLDNYSEYIREMAIKGYVIEIDHTAVKELTREVGYISRSINQIAKRINTTHTIYKEDLDEIKELMEKVWHGQRYILLNQL